jgi:hypothetical protein
MGFNSAFKGLKYTSYTNTKLWDLTIAAWGTTRRKVAGSVPDGIKGIFHWLNFSGHNMSTWPTRPLKEMSTRNIFWRVKAAGAYSWQPYHLNVPTVLKSSSLNLMWPSGPVQGLLYLYLYHNPSVTICTFTHCFIRRWLSVRRIEIYCLKIEII